mmetsp:Transcript_46851/g.86961  ORF Transcript_46851/g.86961 Transcript_46851/m.86961 type:complete len:224 (+) Transcript_46851:753-1424(+)
MDGEEQEAQPELEVAFDCAQHEVEGEYRHTQYAEEREPSIEPHEVPIEEGSDGVRVRALGHNIQYDVKDPADGHHERNDSKQEGSVGYERVVILVVRRAVLEVFHVLFQQVHRLLELQESLLLLPLLLPLVSTAAAEESLLSASVVRPLVPVDLDQFANVHQFVHPLSDAQFRLSELHGVHVPGPIHEPQDEIEGHGRQTDASEQGEKEPPEPRHESRKEGGD